MIDNMILTVYTVYSIYIQSLERDYNHYYYIIRGAKMDIIISTSLDEPIYEQIVSQIKSQIMSGELVEGDALPSMRLLAKQLRISLITTKRAYEELEKSGFIVTYAGKGCFVSGQNKEILKEEYLKQIEGYMEQAVTKAKHSNVSLENLHEMLDTLYEEL